ncbi:low-complexity protein [Marichromatium bheemlicum]|uniref:Low-complexity protein n=1 Tax=Marichromatium bheemlicum TaxID=365339 RepID=A0ABX1IAR2_9GAMM|nr:low-complexity protein [Marichromatium bheemlicum]NKN33956.1 low-complexity protein [Marichromatium bheemlicum]
MSDIKTKTTLTTATGLLGAALIGNLAAIAPASAEQNPFAATVVESGHLQLASSETEGKCGGAGGDKDSEGNCGGMEGKCGEGKCGGAS